MEIISVTIEYKEEPNHEYKRKIKIPWLLLLTFIREALK